MVYLKSDDGAIMLPKDKATAKVLNILLEEEGFKECTQEEYVQKLKELDWRNPIQRDSEEK